ncbi:hypothetical protein ACJJTC_001052 [Scirpophaga incertulas]
MSHGIELIRAPRGGVHRAARRPPGGLAGRVPLRRRLQRHQERAAAVLQRRRREAIGAPKSRFKRVIKANIGDAHAMGQTPITFIRQVIACVALPELIQTSNFPEDVKKRANDLLDGMGGRSAGSYTMSHGIELIRAPRGGVHRAARRPPGGLAGRVPLRRRLQRHQERAAAVLQRRRREAIGCQLMGQKWEISQVIERIEDVARRDHTERYGLACPITSPLTNYVVCRHVFV